jgi:hypothetical protein
VALPLSFDCRRQVVVANNRCFSNWFRLRLAKQLRFHQTGCLPWYRGFTRPYRVHGAHLVIFANGYEIKQRAWHGTRVMSPCLRPTPNREAQVATERGPLWMSR